MSSAIYPLSFVITAIREETYHVKTFVLAAVDGSKVVYSAGQFLTFSFTIGGKEERRSYSISSSPALKEPLAITVKRVDNGAFSRWLIDRARVGDILLSTGIAGLFTLPSPVHKDVLFFAAGIGITPVYSLLKELLAGNENVQATLIYSNRNKEEVVFADELKALQEAHGNRFKIEWIYSNNKQLLRARLTRSLMDELLRQYLHNPTETLSYICGPSDYRWMVQLLLEEAGIPSSNIRQEIFITERNTILQVPPDKDAHEVTVHYRDKTFVLNVQYPDTILMAAKKAGIGLPYSCEAGRCSSCVAHCTKGKVWIAYNEVLTEKDLQNGLILTCTGYAIDGDVEIFL